MDKYKLCTSTEIGGKECEFDADFRNIIHIMNILNEPNLLEEERIAVALDLFYNDSSYKSDILKAVEEMFFFISYGSSEDKHTKVSSKPLYDWEQDFDLIIAPVNKTLGFDCRGKDFLHWWTFLSAFMEMGECTLNTYMGIRDKLNKGKKLEKYEERIYRDNRDKIILKQKVDDSTQSIIDEIMGY